MENNIDNTVGKPVLNSNTASEEDVAKYMSTLSPEEREAYIDYMIAENKAVAEKEWEKDAKIIEEMNAKKDLNEEISEGQAFSTTDEAVLPEEDKKVFSSTSTKEATSHASTFTKSPIEEPNAFSIDEDDQKTLDNIKKKKKSSHIMLYITLGCFIFLVLLMIAAKIILSPTVTIAMH